MQNLKPFDPKDIDETLTRVVTYGRSTYLLFPYINATGNAPEFNSVSHVILGAAATLADFAALSALLVQTGEINAWYISFNTPWLLTRAEAENIRRQRSFVTKAKRD